jgi:hypothetical protein
MNLIPSRSAVICGALVAAAVFVYLSVKNMSHDAMPLARYHVECSIGNHVDVYDDTPQLTLHRGGGIEVNGITYSQGSACKFWNMKRPQDQAIFVPRNKFD